jgi:hypothetical protein
MVKKLLVLCLFLLGSHTMFAQDLITLKTGEEIEAKVIRVTVSEVEYKKWSNVEGPDYIVSKDDVFMIKYVNGEKEVFNMSPDKENKKAQNKELVTPPIRKNAVFSELGGIGYFVSLNYERMFYLNDFTFVAWRMGISPMGPIGTLSTALTFNVGTRTDFLELGAGTGYYYAIGDNYDGDQSVNYSYVAPCLGYRRISKSGFLFKTYVSLFTLKEAKTVSSSQTVNNGFGYTYTTQVNRTVYQSKYYPFAGFSFGLAF